MSRISSVGGIQAELAVRLNEVSADEADTYLNWINLITQDISLNLTNPRYLEASAYLTTSSGTRNYSLASDFSQMYDMTIPSQNVKLTFIPKEQYDTLITSNTTGAPQIYTIYQEALELGPTPNSSLDIYYRYAKTLGAVSAASAALPIPEAYLEMYINRGVAYGLERRGDYSQAQVFHKRYNDLLDKMNSDMKSIEAKRMKSIREFRGTHSNDPVINQIWS